MKDLILDIQFYSMLILCLILIVCLLITTITACHMIAIKGVIYCFIGMMILTFTIMVTTD